MNCPVCFEDTDYMYTLACGSNTLHQICNSCEILMRCAATPTNRGRFIKCPLCRVVEPVQGERTIQSYKAELTKLYEPEIHTFDIIIFIENIIAFIIVCIMFIICWILIITAVSYIVLCINGINLD